MKKQHSQYTTSEIIGALSLFIGLSVLGNNQAMADAVDIDRITVVGQKGVRVGEALSASEGTIGQYEINNRPLLRPGEVLEFVPGMVVTQHSGSGKGNQYFLRGFNLDHGTDFRIILDGMPVNMRTHGHGQGYADLNFVIPEFLQSIQYQKGPYHSQNGDFSTAGSAEFNLSSDFGHPFVTLELGEHGYLRGLAGTDIELEGGKLLAGAEWHQYDGPWQDINEDIEKTNALLRYISKVGEGDFALTFMAYDNQWNSADQIPERAVSSGLISALGSLDTTVGGESSRYSISSSWEGKNTKVQAYAVRSQLNLFSNFTYFLEDPVNGDQFEQVDDRVIWGGDIQHFSEHQLFGKTFLHTYGAEFQYDDIREVGLFNTRERLRLNTVRQDSVESYSASAYWQSQIELSPALRASLGARYDYIDVDVDSNLDANSGADSDALLNFNGSLVYMLSDSAEMYISAGQSFHSNDARGATITLDPITRAPTEKVDLLVRGEGAEFGFRMVDNQYYSLSTSIWTLELDSELVFVGDAGNVEPTRSSRRSGVEIAAYYWINDTLDLDLELAWTRSRFEEDEQGEGDYIDGSLPFVASAGLTYKLTDKVHTVARLRHFGKRTLDSFNIQRSDDFTAVNLAIAYDEHTWSTRFEVLNVFDSNDHDIDYFYASRLPGEPEAGVEDKHFHPIEPRMLRASFTYRF